MSQVCFPLTWTLKSLGSVADVVDPHPSHRAPPKVDEGIPFVGIGDVSTDGFVDFSRARVVSHKILEEHRQRYSLDESLIGLGRVASVGKVVRLPNASYKYVVSPTLAVVRPFDVDFEFLFYALQSPDFQMQLSANKQGSGRESVGITRLRTLDIPMPPLDEQKKIVEILEEQFSRLDAALASVLAVRVKSERFRRSLLHTAFTGELTGHDTLDGTLPVGWKRGTIAQVAEVVAGRTPTKFEQRLAGSTVENRNVPFYKVGDMNSAAQYLREARVYFAEDESGSFGIEILPAGTVIFPKAGGAIATNKKRVLEVPGAIDLNCMGVSSNGVLLPQLLYWFFESFNLSSIADGSVLPQIGKKKVSSIEICYPESEFEQRKLLEDIEASVSRSDAVDRMSEAIEQKAAAFRRSLLHAAFSGDLTKEWREGAHV